MSPLSGRTALVTGAGGGLGRAFAQRLAAAGTTTWLVGRTQSTLDETAAGCGANGIVRAADLRDDAVLDVLVGEVGDLDVLVHCAGTIDNAPLDAAPVGLLDEAYRANVRVFARLVQGVLPGLERRGGDVVVLNSSVVRSPRAGSAQFAASQHALLSLTDTLRQEVNDRGIRVLSVFPGRVATSRQQRLYEEAGREYRPELLLQPESVAELVVAALALPRSAEVTDIHIRPARRTY